MLLIMYSNIGTPNYHHFPFGTNGKIVVLGVLILKHCRVSYLIYKISNIIKMSYDFMIF